MISLQDSCHNFDVFRHKTISDIEELSLPILNRIELKCWNETHLGTFFPLQFLEIRKSSRQQLKHNGSIDCGYDTCMLNGVCSDAPEAEVSNSAI